MNGQLIQTEKGLALTIAEHPEWQPLIIDFHQGTLGFRQKRAQHELIIKAIGLKAHTPLIVYDTTAGLGKEAFLMASMGATVYLFERHPLIKALLADALARAADLAPVQRMHLVGQCAIDYLAGPHDLPRPDVIYCDPMFESRTKSAKVKKDMQMLQTLMGQDPDAAQLVALACGMAKKRVVVKRARLAPPLKDKVSFQLAGRSHRFDVYQLSCGHSL